MVDLANTEWEMWGSRKVKSHYNLDSRMNIQGSPDQKEYGLYVLDSNSLMKTIEKIQSEIRFSSGLGIHNYLIITKVKILTISLLIMQLTLQRIINTIVSH